MKFFYVRKVFIMGDMTEQKLFTPLPAQEHHGFDTHKPNIFGYVQSCMLFEKEFEELEHFNS